MTGTTANQTTSQRNRLAQSLKRWALPVLATVVISSLGFVSFREANRSAVKNVDAKLTTILEAAVKGLTIWTDEKKRNANYIADQAAIREHVATLVRLSNMQATKQELLDAPEQEKIAAVLAAAMASYDYVDYAVLDPRGRVLVDGIKDYVGEQAPPIWDEYLPIVLSGSAAVARPHRRFFRAFDAAGELQTSQALMFVAAPIRADNGDVIAAIAFGIMPEKEFTDILTVARAGDSGETFAFDEDGWMLSDSRFDDQLKSIGLLRDEPVASAVLSIRLVEPDAELGGAGSPTTSRPRPLTGEVAATLMAKQNGNFEAKTNLAGYTDYRGSKVVGAFKWLPEHNIGIATKIDYDEAYAPSILVRNIIAFLFGLVILGVAVNLIYTRILGRVRRRMLQAEQAVQRLGQYTLEEKIGEGGMGTVYRASHAMLRRPTAVKLLRPDRSSEEAIARFEREVQLTAQLTHPNTIAIYDYGRTPENIFYYAMEFLAGFNLNQVVELDGPQSAGRVIFILQQICDSLQEAHAANLIHRDIKPANVFLCRRGGLEDVVKVLDFGMVKDLAKDTGENANRKIAGTPLYMSPEAIEKPETVDARSDVYAVGAVGYFLVTGTDLFAGENLPSVLTQQISEPPTPPAERLGGPVDADLAYIIMHCLEKAPSKRPQSVAELAAALARCESVETWTQAEARQWWQAFRDGQDRPSPEEALSEFQETVAADIV